MSETNQQANPDKPEATPKISKKVKASTLLAAGALGVASYLPIPSNPFAEGRKHVASFMTGEDQAPRKGNAVVDSDPATFTAGMNGGLDLARNFLTQKFGKDNFTDEDVIKLGQEIHDVGRGNQSLAEDGTRVRIDEREDGEYHVELELDPNGDNDNNNGG